ncbi:hypothetical protein A2U01_0108556 [Trifolium medium]|uniref:Uncharacterized protein n=1 Tax=Trifolium medium TaxID=97028 RepID=A0A392VFW9_9FABA|nr:hypothetical protein [Trifolium medium]
MDITKLPQDPLWEVPDLNRSISDPVGVQADRLKRENMSVLLITFGYLKQYSVAH